MNKETLKCLIQTALIFSIPFFFWSLYTLVVHKLFQKFIPEIYEELRRELRMQIIWLIADWNLNAYGEATALKILLLIAWPVGLPILLLGNL